jgi:hypothetical protein
MKTKRRRYVLFATRSVAATGFLDDLVIILPQYWQPVKRQCGNCGKVVVKVFRIKCDLFSSALQCAVFPFAV